MNKTLRFLAILSLFGAAAMVMTLSSYSQYNASAFSYLETLAVMTTGQMLSIATGVVALVATAQRRHWRWFTLLLIFVLITAYWEFLLDFILASFRFFAFYQASPSLVNVAPFAVTALTVLVYSLLSLRQKNVASTSAPIVDPDFEIEYTPLNTPSRL